MRIPGLFRVSIVPHHPVVLKNRFHSVVDYEAAFLQAMENPAAFWKEQVLVNEREVREVDQCE
jgi:hypothetical protein